jgi:signal transduction histidine kinase
VDVLNRLSMLSYEQSADTTLLYADQAKSIARRIGYAQGLADATNNLGVYFEINGNFALSLKYFGDAHQQYIRLRDSANMVQTLMNIAEVYNSNGDTARSVAGFRQAMAIGAGLRNDSIMSLVIYNYLQEYPGQFAPDSMDWFISRSAAIANKYKDIRVLLALGQLRADRLLQAGNREAAVALLEKTLDEGRRQRLYFMCLDILDELGDLYTKTDSARALAYYRQELSIIAERGYTSNALDVNTRLYHFYLDRKDTVTANRYAATIAELYEQKQTLDNQSGVDYITYALKDQQLETAREREEYNRWLSRLEGVACFLIVVICYMLWRNARRGRAQYRKLASTTAALETSNQDYARLIRVVAHDLRNPIGAIFSISEYMSREDDLSEETRQWIQLIENGSSRCLQLITELLRADFEITEATLHKVAVDLPELLRQTVQMLEYRAAAKRQRLETGFASLPVVLADTDKLTRVIDNLVVNAIKFSPENATIRIAAEATPTEVTISVSDQGIGIPPEIAASLFEPFRENTKRAGTAGEQSFGLGLYICRQIVEAHHGRIWFESQPGQGSTFYVAMPH